MYGLAGLAHGHHHVGTDQEHFRLLVLHQMAQHNGEDYYHGTETEQFTVSPRPC